MEPTEHYLRMISRRGDRCGRNGGLLDLLDWCGKRGLYQVTQEEAKRFWESPTAPYGRS